MKKILFILIISVVIFSCSKTSTPNNPPPPHPPGDTTHGDTVIDYSNWMPVRNLTAYSSSIDSIAIAGIMYHILYIQPINSGLSTDIRYFNVPQKDTCQVRFYLTIGLSNTPVEITVYQPDGTYFESTNPLKYQGKDSSTFTMPISNQVQVNLVKF